MRDKISVVMTTYNGEKYIVEQMESIRTQTKNVDEVIIKDDCSSDDTCKIVSDYIGKYNLENWKLISNENNLGWKTNFASVIEMASGDFVFLCDQDDIWMNNKVEVMYSAMKNNTNIDVLVSNYQLFIDDGVKSYVQGQKKANNHLVEKYHAKNNFIYTKYPGCVYCIKAEILDIFKKYWNEKFSHDTLLWHIAYIRNGLYVVQEDLIKYRRHDNTATGRKISDKKDRLQTIDRYKCLINMYRDYIGAQDGYADLLKGLIRIEKWNNNREKIVKNRNVFSMIKNIRYLQYYWSFKTYISDILWSFK